MDSQTKRNELKGIVRRVYKQSGKAIAHYNMLNDGDRILIALSGGLDSLSLLRLFMMRKGRIPIKFDFVICFVDTNFIKINKDILTDYVKSLGLDLVVKKLVIEDKDINCFYCSWARRKILFETAREYKCNKVALGHNMDDINETTLMNFFFFGEISTMRPIVELFKGEIALLRPLCYIEKREIEEFADYFSFPDTHYDCPYGKDTRRQRIKNMIQNLEKDCPFVKKNIFRALGRIKTDYLL